MPRTRRSRVTAVVESQYQLREAAEAISVALEADNASTKDASVKTERVGNRVITRVESVSLEKLLPVLDDLLLCQSVAERTLRDAGRARDQKSF